MLAIRLPELGAFLRGPRCGVTVVALMIGRLATGLRVLLARSRSENVGTAD